MFNNKECGLKVAEFLLQIKAIKLQPNKPFTWASGWNSPIYCDNRKILSYPKIRTYIRQQFVEMIEDTYGKPDVIAGVATGGIAIGALVAEEMGVPFVYVRSSTKGHGLQNKVEGVLDSSQNVVIVRECSYPLESLLGYHCLLVYYCGYNLVVGVIIVVDLINF